MKKTNYQKPTAKNIRGNIWVGVLLFLMVLSTIGLALISDAVASLAQSRRQAQVVAAQSICDGGVEKAMWKLNKTAGAYTGESNVSMDGVGVLDIQVTTVDADDKTVIVTATVPNKTSPKKVVRKVKSKVHISFDIVSFSYALQLGNQGLHMEDWTTVKGSVYTSGSIVNDSTWWWLWWLLGQRSITGNAYTSGTTSAIINSAIGGEARSHTLTNDRVKNDAWYTAISGTTVGGTKHPNSPDLPDVGMAVTDEMAAKWEQDVHDDPTVTTFTGNKTINGGRTETIGPMEITGNLLVDNGTLILKGPVWVHGTITIQNGANVKLDNTYQIHCGYLVADGKILIQDGVYIQGNPSDTSNPPKSYIMIITRATSADLNHPAIDVHWGANTTVAYCAPNGTVWLYAGVKLRAVSARGLYMAYGVIVEYSTGMASLDVADGPGASWQIKEWQVCQNGLNCN
jgi:hypothetical protein